MGTFPKARRFDESSSALNTSSCGGGTTGSDANSGGNPGNNVTEYSDQPPGPKYNPVIRSTRIPIGFSRTSHVSSASASSPKRATSCPLVPGPGDYYTELPWNKGVSFASSSRHQGQLSNNSNSTPGPGDYLPEKPPKRTRAARIAPPPSVVKQSHKALLEAGPKYAPLEVMDRALSVTRPSTCGVSFPKASRGDSSGVGGGSAVKEVIDGLPHAYDIESAFTTTKPNVRGGAFSKSSRIQQQRPDTDGRLVALPPADVDSNHTAAPRVSFTKASYSRGVPDRVGRGVDDVPTAKYYPTLDAVSPAVKGVVGWGKPPPKGAHSDDGGKAKTPATAGIQYIEATSTLGGPGFTFGGSRRPAPYPTSAQAPVGPGSYNPAAPPRRTAPAVGFPKAKRDGLEAVLKPKRGEGSVDGPAYQPNYFVGRPNHAGVSISRAPRKLRLGEGSSGPDALYNPTLSQTRPNGRSGVLYLTG